MMRVIPVLGWTRWGALGIAAGLLVALVRRALADITRAVDGLAGGRYP